MHSNFKSPAVIDNYDLSRYDALPQLVEVNPTPRRNIVTLSDGNFFDADVFYVLRREFEMGLESDRIREWLSECDENWRITLLDIEDHWDTFWSTWELNKYRSGDDVQLEHLVKTVSSYDMYVILDHCILEDSVDPTWNALAFAMLQEETDFRDMIRRVCSSYEMSESVRRLLYEREDTCPTPLLDSLHGLTLRADTVFEESFDLFSDFPLTYARVHASDGFYAAIAPGYRQEVPMNHDFLDDHRLVLANNLMTVGVMADKVVPGAYLKMLNLGLGIGLDSFTQRNVFDAYILDALTPDNPDPLVELAMTPTVMRTQLPAAYLG